MTIDEIISKLEEKHTETLNEYSRGHENNKVMQMYRTQMKDTIELISQLKEAEQGVINIYRELEAAKKELARVKKRRSLAGEVE
jgi:hypothetical protein